MELPAAYLARMRAQLGAEGYAAYLAAMALAPRRALRVNTLKSAPEELSQLLGAPLARCEGAADGFFLPEGVQPGRHPAHLAGLFYMQEPSAQTPAQLLDVRPGEAALDLCAAPGGKAGQLAAALQNDGLLVANEVSPARAAVLRRTLERLGARCAVVTAMRPDALCAALPGAFDAVLVDAPCSGEGMFRREAQAVRDWSEAAVAACAARQRAILDSAAAALRPGGRLVYSTCTFSPEENEETVAHFLRAHPDFSPVTMRRLYPHTSPGEGQFAALLVRGGGGAAQAVPPPSGRTPPPAFAAFCREALAAAPDAPARLLPDGRVFLLPRRLPPHMERLRVLAAGVEAGEITGGSCPPMRCSSPMKNRCSALPSSLTARRLPPSSPGRRCRAPRPALAMPPCAGAAIRSALASSPAGCSKTTCPRGCACAEARMKKTRPQARPSCGSRSNAMRGEPSATRTTPQRTNPSAGSRRSMGALSACVSARRCAHRRALHATQARSTPRTRPALAMRWMAQYGASDSHAPSSMRA